MNREERRPGDETYVVRPGEARVEPSSPRTARSDADGATSDTRRSEASHGGRWDRDNGDGDAVEATPETAEIRAEIERTRASMGQTIDELQVRLDPQRLKEQTKEAVRDATIGRAERMVSEVGDQAREVSYDMMDTIRENPIPAALVGIGLGWLFTNRSSGASRRVRYVSPRYRGYADESYPVQSTASGYRETSSHREGMSVGDVQERAGEMAHQARHAAEEFTGNVSHKAADAGSSVVDTIRANPIPAAMAAAGLGWLLINGSGDSHDGDGYRYRSGMVDDTTYPYGGATSDWRGERRMHSGGGVGDTVGSAVSDAQEAVGDAVSDAQEAAGRVAERAQHAVGDAVHEVQRFGGEAQYRIGRTRYRVEDMIQENPMAAGAVALAVGAVVGMSLPSTRREHEIMGETRDHLLEQAQSAVQETAEKAQHVAETATHAAQEDARNQRLSA